MKNNIYIFTDNTSDYPKHLIEKEENLVFLPLSVGLGNDQYDFINTFIDLKTFYTRLHAGEKCFTSMINEDYCTERFKEILDKGFDIIYVAFSSALSGTFECGKRICDKLALEYPNRKITIIDSKAGSMGEGLLLYYTLKFRRENMSYEEIVEKTIEYSNHCGGYFTVGDLNHCAKMGRISKAKALIGNIINIFQLMYINILGELIPFKKIITRKKLLNGMLSKYDEMAMDISKQEIIMVGHSDCIEDGQYIADQLKAKYGNDINVVISDIGHIVGGHGGKNSIALFFLCKEKLEDKDAHVAHLINK